MISFAAETNLEDKFRAEDTHQLVTVFVGDQMFGLPILQVRDVFIVSEMTPVPLAGSSIAGLFNLRGRVMTMLSMRAMLGYDPAERPDVATAVGLEWQGETFGLLVDRVGEVMTLQRREREANPANLDSRWSALSAGVHRLSGELLVEISLSALFGAQFREAA